MQLGDGGLLERVLKETPAECLASLGIRQVQRSEFGIDSFVTQTTRRRLLPRGFFDYQLTLQFA